MVDKPFKCLYCGGEEYFATDHWKTCTNCGDPVFLKWAMRVTQGLRVLKMAEDNANDPRGKPTPRPLES